MTNIGPRDIMTARPHLVLGLLWQMVKMALMARQHGVKVPPPQLGSCASSGCAFRHSQEEAELLSAQPLPRVP